MIDMSAWRETTVNVLETLRLDPRNVRLDTPAESPEVDIIQDLFQNEKAFELVQSIVQVGYFTHELPIVVSRDEELIVVEGNRRVAALKAIQNPYLAPVFQSRIDNLVRHLPLRETLQRITVMVAPSQEEANQLIAALHTGSQRVAWSRVRQAAFFDAQLEADATLGELAARYPTIDVRGFARRSSILKLFRNVHYQDPELAKFVRKSNFPLTVLERLYSNSEFQKIAGIAVEPSTTQATVKDGHNFAGIAEKVIGDIFYKRVNTRRLNSAKSDDFTEYLQEMRALSPIGRKLPGDGGGESAEPTPTDFGFTEPDPSSSSSKTDSSDDSSRADISTEPPVGPRPAASPKQEYLNTSNLSPWQQYPELEKVFSEVGRIPIRKFPNATHDLLRTVLEKTIKAYAESRNAIIPVKRGSHVQLRDCLDWLVSEFDSREECRPIRHHAKLLKDGTSGNKFLYQSSQSYMNDINYNFRSCAIPEYVEGAWITMRPVIAFMFKDAV